MWSQTGDINHTVSFGASGPNSGSLKPGETFRATFDTPGTYRYVCSFHSQMEGTIEVS